MAEFIGWFLIILCLYLLLKKIISKKKKDPNEIILDRNFLDHYGPFSGSYKNDSSKEG